MLLLLNWKAHFWWFIGLAKVNNNCGKVHDKSPQTFEMPKTKDIKSTKPNELTQASEQNTTQTNSIREFFYEQTYVRVLVRDGRALKRIAYAEGGLYVISISLFFFSHFYRWYIHTHKHAAKFTDTWAQAIRSFGAIFHRIAECERLQSQILYHLLPLSHQHLRTNIFLRARNDENGVFSCWFFGDIQAHSYLFYYSLRWYRQRFGISPREFDGLRFRYRSPLLHVRTMSNCTSDNLNWTRKERVSERVNRRVSALARFAHTHKPSQTVNSHKFVSHTSSAKLSISRKVVCVGFMEMNNNI